MDLTKKAQALRTNATIPERRLWRYLRLAQLGVKFRRQVPIGRYIVDFLCEEAGLVIELDGGHHAEQEAGDLLRTAYLERRGYRVLRVWNPDVISNVGGVVEFIRLHLGPPPPWRAPPPSGGGGEI